MSLLTRLVSGFVIGLATPPILTKLVLQPLLIDSKFDEVDSIKHDLDYLGWNIRMRQQEHGVAPDALYVPTSYYQGRY